MANFYVPTAPVFRTIPELGEVVTFGRETIIANKAGLKRYRELEADAFMAVALVCEDKGNNIVFFQGEPIVDESDVMIYKGVSVAYGDSFKPVSETNGVFIAIKYGGLQFWTSPCFVPYVINSLEELRQLADQIKVAITDLPSLHKGRVAQTLEHVASYEEMGIKEEYSLLVSLHLLLYRPKEPMYQNFKKQLESFVIGNSEPAVESAEQLAINAD